MTPRNYNLNPVIWLPPSLVEVDALLRSLNTFVTTKSKASIITGVVLLATIMVLAWWFGIKSKEPKGTYLPDSSKFPTDIGSGWRIDWMRKDYDVSFFDGNDRYLKSIIYAPGVPDDCLKHLRSRIILKGRKIPNGHTRIVDINEFSPKDNSRGPTVNGRDTVYVRVPEYYLQVIRFPDGGIPDEDWFSCAIIDGNFKILGYSHKKESEQAAPSNR